MNAPFFLLLLALFAPITVLLIGLSRVRERRSGFLRAGRFPLGVALSLVSLGNLARDLLRGGAD